MIGWERRNQTLGAAKGTNPIHPLNWHDFWKIISMGIITVNKPTSISLSYLDSGPVSSSDTYATLSRLVYMGTSSIPKISVVLSLVHPLITFVLSPLLDQILLDPARLRRRTTYSEEWRQWLRVEGQLPEKEGGRNLAIYKGLCDGTVGAPTER